MDALAKIGSALMGIGGILIGIMGIMIWADVTLVAWYQGLSYFVVGVGLLLWAIVAVFSPTVTGAAAQRSSA